MERDLRGFGSHGLLDNLFWKGIKAFAFTVSGIGRVRAGYGGLLNDGQLLYGAGRLLGGWLTVENRGEGLLGWLADNGLLLFGAAWRPGQQQ